MTEKNKNALIVFARKPVLGEVKTRLAAGVGNIKALEIYEKLLAHTIEVARASNVTVFVFLTEPAENNIWKGLYCELQTGSTLGERMQNAFELLFNRQYHNCIIIGSDCPALSIEILNTAFTELNKHDVVIGAANDGGYYLLGMKKIIPALFINKKWSTASVFEDTLIDLNNEKLTYNTLPVLSDLDEEKDIPLEWL